MRRLLPIAFGLVVLVAWEASVRLNHVPEYVVPGPMAIARAFGKDGADLLAGLLVTLEVTVAALVLAALTGAALAFALSQSRLAEQTLFPYAVFLQVTPIVTIAPFIIIWVSNVFVVLLILAWMAAVFPIISNTLLGLKSADPNLRDLFRLYGASRWQTATRLLAPSALPYFLGGLRISGGLALIGTVVAEMVAGTSGTRSGLASRLLEASYRLELARAMACFVLLSATGLVLYLLLDALSNRLLRHWHESARKDDAMELANPTFARDTLITPIILMVENGVAISTLIDIGAADGTFGLTVLDGINAGLQVFNIDAQETYAPSLRRIEAMLGAPFRITAVGDRDGEIRVRRAAHEYWLSTATHMGAGQDGANMITLPCRRLDNLCAEADVKGPFFIKLDVEGAELDVLRGAEATLRDTAGLLIECPVRGAGGPQFIDIYAFLTARGFSLFDMVRMSHRGSDSTLYQFYAVFIAERVDFRGKKPLRSAAQQAEVTQAVTERRQALVAENTPLIASIKLKRAMG